MVTRPGTEDTSRPWVRTVQDRAGKAVEGDEVSLMEWDSEGEDYARSILIACDPAIRQIDVPAVLQGKDLTPVG